MNMNFYFETLKKQLKVSYAFALLVLFDTLELGFASYCFSKLTNFIGHKDQIVLNAHHVGSTIIVIMYIVKLGFDGWTFINKVRKNEI